MLGLSVIISLCIATYRYLQDTCLLIEVWSLVVAAFVVFSSIWAAPSGIGASVKIFCGGVDLTILKQLLVTGCKVQHSVSLKKIL